MKSSKFIPGFELLSSGIKSFIKVLSDVLMFHLNKFYKIPVDQNGVLVLAGLK